MLGSINGERKLSLNHWRYRLLHWCFSEKNIKAPSDSMLPQYLYSHYCPLFHLTNFIAIFSWFILIIKVCAAIFIGVVEVLHKVDWSFLKPKSSERVEREPSEDELKKKQWQMLVKLTLEHHFWRFESFWSYHSSVFSLLDKEEVKTRYEELVVKIEEAQERAEISRKRMRDRILFWVNFSRAIIKWFLYVFYIAIGLGALWLASVCFWPVIGFFGWLFNFEFSSLLPLLVFSGKILIGAILVTGVVMLVRRFKVVQTCGSAAWEGAVACSPPFVLLVGMVCAPFKWIAKGFMNAKEFVEVFYEENCPPISIVSDDEAAIEEAIEESVI